VIVAKAYVVSEVEVLVGETGREPTFDDLPDVNLELLETDTLDGRLVALEYRPATATAG
jgi:hypothetical protein